MKMTMTQKILAAHAGLSEVTAGQLINAKLDIVLGNDITTGKTYKAQPFPPFIQNIIKAGGLLKSLKEAENK